MYNVITQDNIIKIYNDDNWIKFYPSNYTTNNSETKIFCYVVDCNYNCNKDFFKDVFKNIIKYKDIKLDFNSKKFHFNFEDRCEYTNLLEDLSYLQDQYKDIYFISYRIFDLKEIDDDRLININK